MKKYIGKQAVDARERLAMLLVKSSTMYADMAKGRSDTKLIRFAIENLGIVIPERMFSSIVINATKHDAVERQKLVPRHYITDEIEHYLGYQFVSKLGGDITLVAPKPPDVDIITGGVAEVSVDVPGGDNAGTW